MWLSNRRATVSALVSTAPAPPSATTASIDFIPISRHGAVIAAAEYSANRRRLTDRADGRKEEPGRDLTGATIAGKLRENWA
jgi:hypothetical protein